MGLFKKIGTFEKYVSPLTGSDANDGSIGSPYATITKSGSSRVLLNGKISENIAYGYTNKFITGDGESAEIENLNQSGGGYINLSALKITNLYLGMCLVSASFCIIKNWTCTFQMYDGNMPLFINNNFIKNINGAKFGGTVVNSNTVVKFYNNTIYSFKHNIRDNLSNINNCIIVNDIDLYNYNSRNNYTYYPVFKYCLFRKSTAWKWNGVTIPINYGTYGNAAGDYMADVISGLYAYANTLSAGTDKTYFLSMIPSAASSNIFYVDANGQTCKVVEDRPSVTGSHQIFNRYVNDAPVDYSLFLDKDNVALTMSDQLSYVGCYKANADVLTFGAVVNVNADGTDDLATTPDMLIADGNGKFHASSADSVQIRNRVRSNVFTFKRGFSLVGFQSQMKSGLNSRFSLGKFQPYNITDAPTLPQESIEVIPYDDAVIPSAFPRFSAMFNDKVQMWYHTAGAKVGLPVLFNDLLADFAIVTDKSLAEYGAWAVTNADYETFTLSTKANVKLQNVPVYFAKVEINLNYHV